MVESSLAWPNSTEEKRLADDVFRETIAALERFNQRMHEAGYKVNKGMPVDVGQATAVPGQQAKSARKLRKAA